MKQFFKFMLASLVGMVLAITILFSSFFIIISIVAASSDKEVKVKDNSVLRITLSQEIQDHAKEDPFENFDFNTFEVNQPLGLDAILENIEKAKTDEKIEGIVLEVSGLQAGMGTIMEIRNKLQEFSDETDKWIYAYSETYTQYAYYLATTADEVHLYPEGGMEVKGLYTEIAMMKGMFDKMGIDMQVFRGPDNKYKSFAETFMYEEISAENREQIQRFIDVIWDDWKVSIGEARGMSVDKLDMLADSVVIRNPKDAVEQGLVDKLSYKDEFEAMIRAKLELEEDKDIEYVSLGKYNKVPKKKGEDEPKSWKVKDKVGVIFAAGGIVSGRGEPGQMGSATIVEAVEAAEKDSTIKAVVLRVNSGGGSALASDVMWRSLEKLKESKPLIVSMGDVAASGGYYISCGGDKIFADANTITGSIGVIGLIPNAGELLKDKMGLNFSTVRTNENANFLSVVRPATGMERTVINESITDVYETFLNRVAEGRGMTTDEVDSIARGRVWVGPDAKEIGLVDELGGLEDAIAAAAEVAELENYKIKTFPEEEDPFEALIKELSGDAKIYLAKELLGDEYIYYKHLNKFKDMQGIQLIMPYEVIIH